MLGGGPVSCGGGGGPGKKGGGGGPTVEREGSGSTFNAVSPCPVLERHQKTE
jgi:hypothetical protein